MELGKKISALRKEAGLSQEQFAEKIGVSRSAIAKWESDKGIPDIENLVRIAKLFEIKVDDLLNEDVKFRKKETKEEQTDRNGISEEYIGKKCYISLGGWNVELCEVIIIGADEKFVYYLSKDKKSEKYGAVAKKHIISVEIEKTKKKEQSVVFDKIDKSYFIGRHVEIHFLKKKGIRGFFDFTDDNYLDVVITSFEDDKLNLEFGKSVLLDKITVIEEV